MENIPLNESIGPSYTNSQHHQQQDGEGENESAFICNICLEVTYKDPVVTLCGHLYCWPCLYRWLNTQHTDCPVCKANVSKDNVIPIFVRGTDQDPRLKSQLVDNTVPNRPVGRRPEPQLIDINGGGNANAQFPSGFGFFPSLFGLQFQSFAVTEPLDRPLTIDEIEQKKLSNLMMALGTLVLIGLVLF